MHLLAKISSKEAVVSVLRLGYGGLPMAVEFTRYQESFP